VIKEKLNKKVSCKTILFTGKWMNTFAEEKVPFEKMGIREAI